MKILNVTPYCISNYGAILQAWALRKILKDLGHTVQYLRYPYLWPGKIGWRGILYSRSFDSLRTKIAINRQMAVVREEVGFWNETRAYKRSFDLQSDPPEADCYLVGSDQVFHLDFLKNIEKSRQSLLNFGSDCVRRVAYAASFGRPSWTAEMIEMHQWGVPLLEHFSAIGLREQSGVEILRQWAGIDGVWTPDPTLLLGKEDYRKQFSIGTLEKSCSRVVSYLLGFANTQQRKTFHANCCRCVMKYFGARNVDLITIRPQQSLAYWLTNIATADYVITNSFHGICFALIFNRPFVALGFEGAESWRNARTYDILAHIGLSYRFLTVENAADADKVVSTPINWENINACLRDFAKIGRNFLRDSLQDGNSFPRKQDNIFKNVGCGEICTEKGNGIM